MGSVGICNCKDKEIEEDTSLVSLLNKYLYYIKLRPKTKI